MRLMRAQAYRWQRWPRPPGESAGGDRVVVRGCVDDQRVVAGIHVSGIALAQVALEHGHRQGVLEPPLDDPLQGWRSVGRVVTLGCEEVECARGQLQADGPLGEPVAQKLELDLDD